MDRKIYYISDWHINPGHYTFDRHRYPQAYIELGPWHILNFKDINQEIKGKGNLIIANTPVHDELRKLRLISELMDDNEVYIGIEGAVWDWLDWPASDQELYIEILAKSKGVLHSNVYDVKMMKVFASNFLQAPPCTNYFIEKPREQVGEYVFIVNPCKGYQRGMIPHKLVYDSVPKEVPVYTMHYDRTPHLGRGLPLPDSYSMPGFQKLNRMPHDEFMSTVYNSKFGVDIHRDFSAGQTAVDFGSLGVPLVGNIELDAQREIFPDISFEWSDYDNFKKYIKLLSVDEEFCKEIGQKALENTIQKYSSNIIVNKFMSDLRELSAIHNK